MEEIPYGLQCEESGELSRRWKVLTLVHMDIYSDIEQSARVCIALCTRRPRERHDTDIRHALVDCLYRGLVLEYGFAMFLDETITPNCDGPKGEIANLRTGVEILERRIASGRAMLPKLPNIVESRAKTAKDNGCNAVLRNEPIHFHTVTLCDTGKCEVSISVPHPLVELLNTYFTSGCRYCDAPDRLKRMGAETAGALMKNVCRTNTAMMVGRYLQDGMNAAAQRLDGNDVAVSSPYSSEMFPSSFTSMLFGAPAKSEMELKREFYRQREQRMRGRY